MTTPSRRQRFNISRLAIRYSRLTFAFWIAIIVAGLLAFSSLKYALFPDITFPVVIVKAKAPLETLAATEAQLAKPLEAPLISSRCQILTKSTPRLTLEAAPPVSPSTRESI